MSELLSDVSGGIARFTINRPQAMNAMPSQLWGDLADLVRGVEHDESVRVILITGAGDNFCAGGDVKEFSTTIDLDPANRAKFWMGSADRGNHLFQVLERVPQPVVVRVKGVAAGGGMAMVAAADLAIAGESSRFLAAQIKVGAVPDSALSYNLVRGVGPKRAKQYCFLGEMMEPQTALEMGLVNWVVPDAELDARTDALLTKLARMPRVALARTKAAMNVAHRISIADHLMQESQDIGACVSEPDFVERVRGFINRSRAA